MKIRKLKEVILDVLKEKQKIDRGELIELVSILTGIDPWNVKVAMWDASATGQLEFSEDWSEVIYIRPTDPKYGEMGIGG